MKLNPIFTSNMVFAAKKPIRIFGTGSGRVSVSFNGITKDSEIKESSWVIELEPMECGGPYTMHITLNDDVRVLENIHIGYVYLFAGQSNMQFKLHESSYAPDLWETEHLLRLYSADQPEGGGVFRSSDGWILCCRESAGDWSALAYLTGMETVKRHSAAVGAVTCHQGASVIESWVPPNLFEDHGIHIPLQEKHGDHVYPEYAAWNGNGVLYECALSQVIPFSLSGVIWYQGESDTSPAEGAVYADELCLMIDRWREDFGDPGLPFIVIQIADYDCRPDEGWRLVQRAQEKVSSMRADVYTVICADVCETDCIHPPTKHHLALRIADALSAAEKTSL